ncbi:hypothetical protein MMC28_008235 [Mycoblastus sanguinarius]|nr:hypothetical protein [Mycoblastus sanguinarius]
MSRLDRRADGQDGRRNSSDDRTPGRRSKEIHYRDERDQYEYVILEQRPSHSVKLSSEEAISALLEAVDRAGTFLSRFKDEFDRETRGIQPYAGSEVLTHLWASKVKQSNGWLPSGRTSQDQQQNERERERQRSKAGFRDMAQRLCDCLGDAVSATRSEQDLTMTKKLRDADKDIYELLHTAARNFKDLSALLTELKILSVRMLERNGARKGSRSTTGREEKARQLSQGQKGRNNESSKQSSRREQYQEKGQSDSIENDHQDSRDSDQEEEEIGESDDHGDDGYEKNEGENSEHAGEPVNAGEGVGW